MSKNCSNAWNALVDVPEGDLKKKSDYLILIWARLNRQSGSQADKANNMDYQLIKFMTW
jgi:hypothetical protein